MIICQLIVRLLVSVQNNKRCKVKVLKYKKKVVYFVWEQASS